MIRFLLGIRWVLNINNKSTPLLFWCLSSSVTPLGDAELWFFLSDGQRMQILSREMCFRTWIGQAFVLIFFVEFSYFYRNHSRILQNGIWPWHPNLAFLSTFSNYVYFCNVYFISLTIAVSILSFSLFCSVSIEISSNLKTNSFHWKSIHELFPICASDS